MQQFVGIALKVQSELGIIDKKWGSMVMKFAKMYTPEKMGKILVQAKTYPWWQEQPGAAFMKAVGEVNKREKEGDI